MLQNTDLFKGIAEVDLVDLLSTARQVEVPKGGVLYKAGDTFRNLVLLCSGLLQSIESGSDGRIFSIQRIQPVQLVGLLYLFGDQKRHDSLIAVEPSQIVLIGVDKLSSLMMSNTQAAFAVCEKFTQIIHALRRDKALLSRSAASGRILGVMSKFLVVDGEKYYLAELPRQQEVADLANTTRETVSRTLSRLLASGVLEKHGKKLQVNRPEMFVT